MSAANERRRNLAALVVSTALSVEGELVALYDLLVEAGVVDGEIEASLFHVQRALVVLRLRAARVR